MAGLRHLFRSVIQTIQRRKQLREELKRNYEECEELVNGIKDDYVKACENILKAYNEKLKEIAPSLDQKPTPQQTNPNAILDAH